MYQNTASFIFCYILQFVYVKHLMMAYTFCILQYLML
jgi:hypothetical protein